LEHAIGYASDGVALKDEDIIVALLDPDMAIMRPITAEFEDGTIFARSAAKARGGDEKIPRKVAHGHPISQHYGLGNQWRDFDLLKITGDSESPAHQVTAQQGNDFFPVGPPYLMTGRDALSIAGKWTEFVRMPSTARFVASLLVGRSACCYRSYF